MNKTLTVLLSVLLILSLVSCTAAPSATEPVQTDSIEDPAIAPKPTVRLMALKGPTGMGLAGLIENDATGSGNVLDYETELVTSAEISNISAALIKGECDIAAVPINLASTLYQKSEKQVKVLAANTLGVLSILENGDSVNSVADLRGKTLYATGQGSTPEYILRYVLSENGLDPEKDLTLQFVSDHAELASLMVANQYAIGMLPEPNVSAVLSSNPSFRVALDLTEEWEKVSPAGTTLVQGVFVVRAAFLEEYPEAVRDFLTDYENSVVVINAATDESADLIVKAGILEKAPLAKKAIPGAHITCLIEQEMKDAVSNCLAVLFKAAPASVGGALPDDAFYAFCD